MFNPESEIRDDFIDNVPECKSYNNQLKGKMNQNNKKRGRINISLPSRIWETLCKIVSLIIAE